MSIVIVESLDTHLYEINDNVETFMKKAFLELYELYEVDGGHEYMKRNIDNFHYHVSRMRNFKDVHNLTIQNCIDNILYAFIGDHDSVLDFLDEYYEGVES